jgi:hypothetical protein
MQTLRQARADFFRREGLPHDGGYDDEWFEAGFGPVRYRIRNFPHRADALFRHDLHHAVTGYTTDWRGEVQINAWELGAGLGGHAWGAVIMLMGFFFGVVLAPADTLRAFARGRRSTNLYTVALAEDALERPAAELARALGVTGPVAPTAVDVAAFLGAVAVSAAFFAFAALPLAGLIAHAWIVQTRRALAARTCPLLACGVVSG